MPALFFVLTVASTLFVGGLQGISYWAPDLVARGSPPMSSIAWLRNIAYYGAPFSITVMLIMLCHEMGHYLTALRYRVDTTLPFFIPFPLSLIGTMGAFIIIKSRFPERRSLIDIGLAGPFAGFLVTIPALFLGVATSRPSPPLPAESSISFGEPLLFQWVATWIWPEIPADHVLYISPIGLAAWFGLLLTALNLMPIGQLDGGHAAYALLREKAHMLSKAVFVVLAGLAFLSPSWVLWALLTFVLGVRHPHPPTMFDEVALPRSRKVMGLLGLATFALCFTPEPIHISWSEFLQSFTG